MRSSAEEAGEEAGGEVSVPVLWGRCAVVGVVFILLIERVV